MSGFWRDGDGDGLGSTGDDELRVRAANLHYWLRFAKLHFRFSHSSSISFFISIIFSIFVLLKRCRLTVGSLVHGARSGQRLQWIEFVTSFYLLQSILLDFI